MVNKILFVLIAGILVAALYISCRKSTDCETCRETNKPPIANAGRDTIVVLPLDSVLLNGSSSKDPDGSIKGYLWSRISGPAMFSIIDSSLPKTFVKKLSNGIYRFQLKVTDDDGLSATDTVIITVDTSLVTHHQPVADAGTDQVYSTNIDALFNDGVTATLDGGNSVDPDNDISSYRWTTISTTGSYALANVNATKTSVAFYDFGVYRFELTVTDQSALSSRDTITISIDRDSTSQLPIAVAGADQTIFLPENSVQLNGSLSWDSDGDLVSYQWTKISGPSSFNILNPNTSTTNVTSLTEGDYQFELKVTDLKTQSSFDTMKVSVIACATGRQRFNATLTPFATLPEQRGAAVASAADKIVFAGGVSSQQPYGSSRVDIYDINTKTWTIAQLSEPRYGITAVVVGNKILFAGGESGELGDAGYEFHSTVDIYDAATNSWSVSSMSEPQYAISAAVVGDKVFFAGGGRYSNDYDKIEIYDASSNHWSIKTLSDRRTGVSIVALDDKVYFAGGENSDNSFSDRIDIYDNASNTWTTATLNQPRAIGRGSISINHKIFWAGGYTNRNLLCSVDIMDMTSQTISLDKLSNAGPVRAFRNENKLAFFGFEKEFEIYDSNTNSWSIGVLQDAPHFVFAMGNEIYMSTRGNPSDIRRVEF